MKEIIITSSVLILCIMLIRIIFKGRISSRLRYALWLLVALRLIVPSSAQIRMAIGSLEGFRVMDIAETLEEKTEDAAARFLLRAEGAQEQSISADGPGSVLIAGTMPLVRPGIVKGVWKGGMAVMAVWVITVNAVFARRLHKNRKPLEIFGDTGEVKIYTAECLSSPCLYGIPFREAVYLTPDVAEDADKLRHVLTHEMCHKRHGDGFWAAVRDILLIVYWMDPLVWAAAALSRRDCELACDEAALAILGDSQKIAYGETLLSIIAGGRKLSDVTCTATTMTESGRRVKERIRYIADKRHMSRAAAAAVLALVLIVSVFVFTRDPGHVGHTWKGEIVLTSGNGLQVRLPETIARISSYDIEEEGDIVIYQLGSGWEAGRFTKAEPADSAGAAAQRPGNADADDREGVPGTDSSRDAAYFVTTEDDAQLFVKERQMTGETFDESAEVVYLPEEKITVTYVPEEKTVVTTYAPDTRAYIEGDYTGLPEKYREEMDYINSELKAAAQKSLR